MTTFGEMKITEIKVNMELLERKMEYSVEAVTVNKNGGEKHGLRIIGKGNVNPVYYPSENDTIDDIVAIIEREGDKVKETCDFSLDKLKECPIIPVLVNPDWFDLKGIIHTPFLDHAFVYKYDVSKYFKKDDENAFTTITELLAKENGLSERDLFEKAKQYANDNYKINNFLGMCFVTNEEKRYGATSILSRECLDEIAEQTDGDFFLIPSSVHEWICQPYQEGIVDKIHEMICTINKAEVAKEDWLGEYPYIYNSKLKQLISTKPCKGGVKVWQM